MPLIFLASALGVTGAHAQTLDPTKPRPAPPEAAADLADLLAKPIVSLDVQQGPSPPPKGLCTGCPPRRLGKAFLQVTVVNGFYELANLARGQVTAHITPETWWTNMKRGWEWDLDEFTVNQFGHPYQGNNYFTAGRANGLDYWESAALTAFGSGTWEYFGETNQASLNDFINTTLGGIALGEMFHRAAWLIRDTHATGKSRLWKEIGATAIDPVTGYNRFRSGDASRVMEKASDMVPSSLSAVTSAGVAWRHSNTEDVAETTRPFLEMDLLYGNPEEGRSRTPYDAFGVRLALGNGSSISEVRVRGRLIGQPFHDGGGQLTVAQGYEYDKNAAYQFGAQSMDVNVGTVHHFNSRTALWANGYGGLTILGAVDSALLPTPVTQPAPEEPPAEEEAGQGVSTGPRFYDYGPGTNAGGLLALRRDRRNLLSFSYQLHHLYVLDGVRANHLLQRARLDFNLPLKGRLGVGSTLEYFDRHTYYQQEGVSPAHFHFPQFRLALTWSTSS